MRARILVTTASFSFYSLIGLACGTQIEGRYPNLGKIGLIACGLGLSYALFTTWLTPDSAGFLQFRFSLVVIALAFAHACLLLLIDSDSSFVEILIGVAIAATLINTFMALGMIQSLQFRGASVTLMGIVAIVATVATVAAPAIHFARK